MPACCLMKNVYPERVRMKKAQVPQPGSRPSTFCRAMGGGSARCVTTSRGVAKTLFSRPARFGSATARVSLPGRRFHSRPDHNFIVSRKSVLSSMPRWSTPGPTGGQGVSSCVSTSNACNNCAVKGNKTRRSSSTRLMICWPPRMEAVAARFVFTAKTACSSGQKCRSANRGATGRTSGRDGQAPTVPRSRQGDSGQLQHHDYNRGGVAGRPVLGE
jgi:hypothetical protein